MAQRLLALTLGILVNLLTGRPGRALAACTDAKPISAL